MPERGSDFLSSRERLLTALGRGVPDRLPVTTHHLMPAFLQAMGGLGEREFFDRYGLDAISWTTPLHAGAGWRPDPERDRVLESWSHVSDHWRVGRTAVPGTDIRTVRYEIVTPRQTLSMVLQDDGRTAWVAERLLKAKSDIEVIAGFAPVPCCDARAVAAALLACGDRGIVRGAIPGLPIYGQPGCWQDAAVLWGIEDLILQTYEDPGWVRALLGVLRDRKLAFVRSTRGAPFDLLELGGGDASSTVISPGIFDRFVVPFDAPVIEAAHHAGQRIVYHTCGGMMPLLERIADMAPDAMETFAPKEMGGDARLAEAKARIGSRVCMIGGFDQFHHFTRCTPEDTRRAVRAAFDQAGAGGGFILAPSDHFFEAEDALLRAYADEARRCRYRGQAPESDAPAGSDADSTASGEAQD